MLRRAWCPATVVLIAALLAASAPRSSALSVPWLQQMGMRPPSHFPTTAALGPGGAGRCAGAAPQRKGLRGVDVRMPGGDGLSIWVVAGLLEAWLFAIWIL
jgi:hypothetical protein